MPRAIWKIADEIVQEWRPSLASQKYLYAMFHLGSIEDNYGLDSARTIVTYFLANVNSWRGDAAKRIKDELREILGIKPTPNGQRRKKTPDSWKCDVTGPDGARNNSNLIRFATKDEARANAHDILSRWPGSRFSVTKSAKPANYKWEKNHALPLD